MATTLQTGALTEFTCSGGYTKKVVLYTSGTQVGNFARLVGTSEDAYSPLSIAPAFARVEESAWGPPISFSTDQLGTLPRMTWTYRPVVSSYREVQCSGGYTKKVALIAPAGNIDVSPPVLASIGTLPAVTLQTETTTVRPEPWTTAGTMTGTVSTPAIIKAAPFSGKSEIPKASGIGLRRPVPGAVTPPRQSRGSSVSFDDFPLGWAEDHRFFAVNEDAGPIPAMSLDVGGENTVVGWCGGQYVGPAIPGYQTADLATAWETAEGDEGSNYAF
jgi:hypothetical protein